jgi:hypothetical protein
VLERLKLIYIYIKIHFLPQGVQIIVHYKDHSVHVRKTIAVCYKSYTVHTNSLRGKSEELLVAVSTLTHGGGERCAQGSSGETRGKEAIGETQT